MLGGTIRAFVGSRTIAGDVPNAPTLEAPRLYVLHLVQLTGGEAREEGKHDSRWGRFREAPGDNQTVDGISVLDESSGSVHPRHFLGKGGVDPNEEVSH